MATTVIYHPTRATTQLAHTPDIQKCKFTTQLAHLGKAELSRWGEGYHPKEEHTAQPED